ncbi:diguanylate cyclase (GGDEF) domain-containing protein [Quadrisphaera granulorum]|uniref:Diguanylate cyclase (GGDEF)-like protein n=1 Tax=Quadrisphaera granulorum TaxID=317664 RepID=A0A316ACN9_9ACTN|nr:diguanylate cyclase (GGDEF)-like protein [Quadrisphaera granulorum]SZE96016.1 diguanylate cyclase (GGDEF) domain-containing protein [Quadrisphaera granulorum]
MWQHLAVLTVVPILATVFIAVEAVLARTAEVADVRAANRQLVTAEQLDGVRRALNNETLPTLALAVVRTAAGTQPGLLTPTAQLQLRAAGSQPVADARAETDAAISAVQAPEALPVLQVTVRALERARLQADTNTAHLASLSAQYVRLSDALLTAEHEATAGAAALATSRSRTATAVADVERIIDLSAQASRQLPLAFTTVVAVPADREASIKQLQAAMGSYVTMAWRSSDLSSPELRAQALAAITDAQTRDLSPIMARETMRTPTLGSADALLALRRANGVRDAALGAVLHTALVEAARASAADSASVQRTLLVTAATAALALIASVLVTTAVARHLTQSLSDLDSAARQAMEGEAVTSDARGPREVRVTSQALERTAMGLRRVREQAEAVAQGDLQRALELPAMPGRLGAVLHSSFEAVVHAVEARDALRAELLHRATHDALTGLPNRTAALAAVSSALHGAEARQHAVFEAPWRGVAVLFVDLDGFKAINDRQGHAAGDQVLVAVAERLRSAVRPADVAARLGGDEFVVVLDDVDLIEAEAVAERIVHDVQAPVALGGAPALAVGASVGLAHSTRGASVTTADQLVAYADAAVYRAKHLGRGRVVVYDAQLSDEAAARRALGVELRSRLASGELAIDWEPVLGMGSPATGAHGDPGSTSAVARWLAVPVWGAEEDEDDDARGCARSAGADLLDLARTEGVCVELSLWALRAATSRAAQRHATDAGATAIAVRLADGLLTDPDLPDHVVDVLVSSDLPPHLLTVVVSEDGIHGRAVVAQSLALLRAAGVRVAVDGTGATPVRDLLHLPADEVWFSDDAPLVPQPGGRRSADQLVLAVSALGLDVVVGGVSTSEQLQRARECGAVAVRGPLAHQLAGQLADQLTRQPTQGGGPRPPVTTYVAPAAG